MSLTTLAVLAIAMSMDAFAAALAAGAARPLSGRHIARTALIMAATLMTAAGMILGRVLGSVAGQYAGMAGGVMLIGIGTSVLLQHTNWL